VCASEQAVAEHDRVLVHEFVVLKHVPWRSGARSRGEVVLEDDVACSTPTSSSIRTHSPKIGVISLTTMRLHQPWMPHRRAGQPLGIPCRLDEGDGIGAFLQVIEGDIGSRAFLPRSFA